MDTAKPLADIAGAILSTDEILLWQADRAGRNKWRKMADSVMTIAASLGIRIRSADKSQLSHVVEIISTIPARKAYDPSSDLA